MEISYSNKPYNKVDYFPLLNGLADVFLHKNKRTEEDEEGNIIYVADEIYFQVKQSTTKEYIEENFDDMWQNAGKKEIEHTLEEKVNQLQSILKANTTAMKKLIRIDELSEKELTEIVDLYDEYKKDYPYEKGDIFRSYNQLYEVVESHVSEKKDDFNKSSKLYKNIMTKQNIGGRV